MYLRTVSPIELPEEARRRPLLRFWRSMERWSLTRSWNVFAPARHGEGRRVRESASRVCSWRSCACCCERVTLFSPAPSLSDDGMRGVDGLRPVTSIPSSKPSKRAPPSVSSNAAAFSAAGVLGDLRCVCCSPILTPMADWTVSSCSSSSSGDSSSEGVRSSSTIDWNWISARAFCRRVCRVVLLVAAAAMVNCGD